MATFKGYEVVQGANGVEVFDPRWAAKPQFVAPNVADAKRWISAYRDGRTWAVMAVVQ